jgi:hypothetical protein
MTDTRLTAAMTILEADEDVESARSLSLRPGVLGSGGPRSRAMSKVSLSRSALLPQSKKRGCAQCAHLGLRIGSYWGRIGPDWRCLRGSPLFARPGVRFESHLGHVFSLFSGLWTSECAQIVHLWAPSGAFLVGRCCGRVLLSCLRVVLLVTCSWQEAPGTA